MQDQITYKCGTNSNPFKCPDNLIYRSQRFDEYGIIIHDGGHSYLLISYCPWCGKKLPESKRDLWFETLRKLGFDNPVVQVIPEKFKSDKWYKNKKITGCSKSSKVVKRVLDFPKAFKNRKN
jgi:hypothetical protein